MKKFVITLILLLAMTTIAFAQEGDFKTYIINYINQAETAITESIVSARDYLEMIDENLEIIKNSPLDESKKQKYIYKLIGYLGEDSIGGFKLNVYSILTTAHRLEIQIAILKEVLPFYDDCPEIVYDEFKEMKNVFKELLEKNVDFLLNFNKTINDFNSDI